MRIIVILITAITIGTSCSQEGGSEEEQGQDQPKKPTVDAVEIFEDEGKYGLQSTEGEVVWPAEYDFARKVEGHDFFWLGKGARLFEEDEKLTAGGDYFLINKHGEQVNDQPYKDIGRFVNGITWVEMWLKEDPKIKSDFGVRRGVIDTAGNVVLDFIYTDIQDFDECGLARIAIYDRDLIELSQENRFTLDDRYRYNYGFMDTLGNIVVQPKFDYLSSKFYDGRCVGSRLILEDDYPVNVLYGYVDTEGDVAIKFLYGAANSFENGKAEVYDQEGNKIVIDTSGNCLEGCQHLKNPS